MSLGILNSSISWKLFPVLVIGVLVCGIGVWIGMPIATERSIRSDVLTNAEKAVNQFKVIRRYYTENVINKALKSRALKPTVTHKGKDGEIPLPATFIHDLSRLLTDSGTTLRLYSPYPFPVRQTRVLDDFGSNAWEALNRNPEKSFIRSEIIEGRNIVRVAVADTMVSQVCVDCHNSRADTPKNDWKLNDLRGVLEIGTDVTMALSRGTLIGRAIALALLGVLGVVLAFTFFRMRGVVIEPVGAMTTVMETLAAGNLNIDIPSQDRVDEIGDMARAVQVFKDNAIDLKEAQDKLAVMNTRLSKWNTALEDQVDSATREMEAFTYSVSHDLRAPLRTVDGFSRILLEDFSDGVDKKARHYLKRIRAGTMRMGALIDDLLSLSRTTRAEMHKEKTNLTAIAEEEAAKLLESDAGRNVEFDFKQDVVVNGDPRFLRVVMNNLLGNAWKYTSLKDRAKIEFGVSEDKNGPVFFVRDDGAGFDMAFADKLFVPFQRLHGVEEFEGNGVGLATVQRIINRHGGKVWAKGEIDKGATVHFTL